ncbi:MAG: Fe-S cluster assembly protein SufD [Elusimicrobiota bacterium]|jgi:Fe-S cluster assembly protein SufD
METNLDASRKDARALFAAAAAPPKSSETWRRTDYALWTLDAAKPAAPFSPFSAEAAARAAKAGAELLSLEEAAARHPDLVLPLLAPCADADYRRLELANLAAWRGGAFLRVPKGVRLSEPVLLGFRHEGEGPHYPRVLVVLEDGASADVVEEHTGDARVCAAFSRAVVGSGARLRCFYTQDLGRAAVHFWHGRVELAADARLEHYDLLLGGLQHKSALDVELLGRGAHSDIRAVMLGRGTQRFDAETRQLHRASRTTSDLLYRTALRERARSNYVGLIRIEREALGCEAYQSNRNLMLSEAARADTTPILEILTDDVRCKHGATAGPLDADQLYYLQTRGLSAEEAARTLVLGFFEPILGSLPDAALAERLRARVEEGL